MVLIFMSKSCDWLLKMATGDAARRIFAIQEDRIDAYAKFNEAHRVYLSTYPNYDFENYKKAVKSTTMQFNELSKAVIEIITEFRAAERHTLTAILEALQEKEKHKLQLTAKWQVAAKECVENSEDEVKFEVKREVKLRLLQVEGDIAELIQDFRYESEDLLLREGAAEGGQ